MRKVLLFAIVVAVAYLCSCNRTAPDNSLQITRDDVIELDGRFEDYFMSGWEYIILDENDVEAILPEGTDQVLYDDGLYFVGSRSQGNIKVFDTNGHYMNNISRIGRARNEYINLRDWTIDRNRNEVLLTSQDSYEGPVTIKRFDYKGEYLEQSETDSIRDGNTFSHIAKCLSDGTFLIENGLTLIPVYDYYYVPQNGPVRFPLEMRELCLCTSRRAIRKMRREMKSIRSYAMNFVITEGNFNNLSDTTYLVRMLDNHIYRLTENGSECIANMAFRPTITKKDIKNFNPNEGMSPLIPWEFSDLKDYLYICYPNRMKYVYDKKTSKVYHLKGDSPIQLPDCVFSSFYGNDKIACIDPDNIQRHLKEIESDDYDHSYSPEIEDFYRKVKDCGNPVIFIAHYDKKPQ